MLLMKKKKYVEPACFSIAMTLHTNKNISTVPSTDFYGFFFFFSRFRKSILARRKKKSKQNKLGFF